MYVQTVTHPNLKRISLIILTASMIGLGLLSIMPIPFVHASTVTINHVYSAHNSGQIFCSGTCTIPIVNVQMTTGDLVVFGLSVDDSAVGGCSGIKIVIVSIIDNEVPPLSYQLIATSGCQNLGGGSIGFVNIYTGIALQTGSFTITTTYTEVSGGSQEFTQSVIDTTGASNSPSFASGFVACTAAPCTLSTVIPVPFQANSLLFSQITGSLPAGVQYCSASTGFTAIQLQGANPCNINGGQYNVGNGMYATDATVNSPTSFQWILNGAQNGNSYASVGVAFSPAITVGITTQSYVTTFNYISLNTCADATCAVQNQFGAILGQGLGTLVILFLIMYLMHEAGFGEKIIGLGAIGALWACGFIFGIPLWIPFVSTVAGVIGLALGTGSSPK